MKERQIDLYMYLSAFIIIYKKGQIKGFKSLFEVLSKRLLLFLAQAINPSVRCEESVCLFHLREFDIVICKHLVEVAVTVLEV